MIRKRVKALLGRVLFSMGMHKRLMGDCGTIVAFHRVSEDAKASDINCTPGQFDEYCRFFGRHFDVIPMGTMVARLKSGQSVRGALSITFDDGYKDNATIAAGILSRHGLPATFFVTSRFVDSDTQVFWDRDCAVLSEWMTWRDVVGLSRAGFDIGGHTQTHIDLGKASCADADREIRGCKQDLEEQLGKPIELFAYPFGGVANIRPDTRQKVRDAGFQCCVSCYGGLVRPGDDLFELQRVPVTTWSLSPYHFGFELLQAPESNSQPS